MAQLYMYQKYINFTIEELRKHGVPEPELVNLVLSDKKDSAKKQALQYVESILNRFTTDVPPVEQLSWPQKAAAARAFIANTQTAEQERIILAEAQIFGGDQAATALALAQKIVAKADVYEVIIAKTSGLKKVLFTSIEAADTAEEIDEYMASAKQQAEAMLAEILNGSV